MRKCMLALALLVGILVITLARKVWQHMSASMPAATARRRIMRQTSMRCIGSGVSAPPCQSAERNRAMGDHASPRTTQLYDRTGDEITLDEVERITI